MPFKAVVATEHFELIMDTMSRDQRVIEAEQLWNKLSEELKAVCLRRGDRVPHLIKTYDRTMSERPSYPTALFSVISRALGVLFLAPLVVAITRVGDAFGTIAWWGLLALVAIADFCWYQYIKRHHAAYEEELLVWDRKIGSILCSLADFICLIKGQAEPVVTVDAAGDASKISHTTMPPWLSSDIANEQLRLLAIRLQESDEGAFDGYLMDLVTEVNRAHKLGVEPISTLGPVNGLRLLLEIASQTDRFNSTSAQSATT